MINVQPGKLYEGMDHIVCTLYTQFLLQSQAHKEASVNTYVSHELTG